MAAIQQGKPFLRLLLLPILLLLCSNPQAANVTTLTQGGPALNSTSNLVSLNGLFTLGFRWLGPEKGELLHDKGTYLGISYVDGSFFWVANRGSPFPDSEGDGWWVVDNSTALTLDQNGTLQLTSSSGVPAVELYSNSRLRRQKLIAQLEDTGSFSVRDADGGNLLWESFDSPTDSWLPGMKLGVVNGGQNRKLTSWLTFTNPSPGAFTLEWDPTAGKEELVMKRRGAVFWTSGKQLGPSRFQNLDLRGRELDFNISRVSNPAGGEDYLTLSATSSTGKNNSFSFWRLRYDGVIEAPSINKTILDSEFCDGNRTENGCLRWDGPECRSNNGDKFVARRGGFMNSFPNGSRFDSNLSISDCKNICWTNCKCLGTTTYFPGDGTSCKIVEYGDFTDVSGSDQALYYVIDREAYGTIDAHRSIATRNKWIGVSVAIAGGLVMVTIFIFWHRRRRNLKERLLAELMGADDRSDKDKVGDDGNPGHHLKMYTMASIIAATDNFSHQNKLGQGGFGPVYKGKLPEGREIAVKKLSESSDQGLVEFRNELILIAKLQHKYLVRLLGCCIHGEEKMLVYEYMPNKSLDSFIFDESNKLLLDWSKRFNIIEGIAHGLLYLHKYSRVRIVHRDLKVSNILLDENLNPKISDFGMARIFKTNALEGNTNTVVGTYGYMSPEYAMHGTFSTKSDVFSFGVMLLEIVSSRKNYGLIQLDPPVNLVGYAWKLWKEGTALEFMDPALEDSCTCKNLVLKCINVGLLCIEQDANDRPTMSQVISMLTSEAAQLPNPKQPAYTIASPGSICVEESSSTGNPKIFSDNEVAISTLNPQ
ncbi:unnamed protein product [Linum tenue]|uniref:Receptor-like serine/threonine-protein kinase n=1 Tax=Linum tenue TaxID=586396 RepID=A0AAV0NE70_9ROSI|nr:unnamed protein product [Linum tenue]